jgi:hypothetical protein
MPTTTAPGLTADWLNGWLAAVGITLVEPRIRLSWTTDARPTAELHHPPGDIAAMIAQALPDRAEIAGLAIARSHPGADRSLDRNVSPAAFQSRAALARSNGDATLAASLTDLHTLRDGQLEHSPLDPPAPQGKTLWDRISACREQIPPDSEVTVRAALAGATRRVQLNGLGFDHRRFLSPADPVGDVWIDPVVELLASVGMTLLPARGDGHRATFRGWTDRPQRDGAFTWPAWVEPLSAAGIDALLDAFWAGQPPTTVSRRYASVAYRPRGAMDQTRGYASRPMP